MPWISRKVSQPTTALQGSSYLKLPRALAWAVGNANYHHVHHLSAKIPNYRLRAAHEEQPMFARTPVVTVRSGIAALGLKLWDEQRGSLVRYPARPARSPAAVRAVSWTIGIVRFAFAASRRYLA